MHGFFYFYFINEHVLRFLGKRYPHDYNKQPWFAFWLGQLVWLFPWSLFLPAALVRAWRNRRIFASDLRYDATNTIQFLDPRMSAHDASSIAARLRFRARTGLLISIFAAFILAFFAISTNQEYYTFPAWFALLMLITGSLASIEEAPEGNAHWINASSRWLTGAHAVFAVIGTVVALALDTDSGHRGTCPLCRISEHCWPIAASAITRSPRLSSSTSPEHRSPHCGCPLLLR